MAKYRVYLQTIVSAAVTVHVPDNLDEDEAREAAIEAAFGQKPASLCVHCTGWGKDWTRDEGEWDVERNLDETETKPVKVED